MVISVSNTGVLSSDTGLLDEIGQYMTFYDEANTTLYFDATGRFPYSTATAGTWLNLAPNTKTLVANTSALGATVANTYGPNAMIFNNTSATAGRIDRTAASNTIIGPAITSGTGKMTAAVWAYNTNWYQTTGQRFVSSTQAGGWSIAINDPGFTGTTSVGIAFYNITAGGYRFMEANTRNAFTSSTGWNHLAWTFDGKYAYFYINGQVADAYTAVAATNYIDVGACLAIGAEASTNTATTSPYLSGALASIFVSNRSFSNTEIYNLFRDTDPNIDLPGSRTYVVNSTYSTATTIAPNTPAKYYSNGALRTTGTDGFDEVSMSSGSLFFNGTSQYLTVPANTAFATGTGDFTVEAWIYHNGAAPGGGVTNDRLIFGGFNTLPSQVFFLTNGALAPALWDGTTQFTGTSGITPNTWNHVAWVRASNVLSFYINGVQVGPSVTSITTNFTATRTSYIGKNDTASDRYFPGYITNLRFVKGTALFLTADFTPPKSSILEAVPNTSLLLQCANSTSATVDSSPNKFTVTNNGNVGYSPSGIGYLNSNLGSILFNGSSQYLTAPSNTAFQFGSGDFTIEAWIYPTTATTNFITTEHNYGSLASHYFYINSGVVTFVAYVSNSGTAVSTAAIQTNTWNHVSCGRSGSTIWVSLNGVRTTAAFSGTLDNPGQPFNIGRQTNGTYFFNGYISNLRVVKGTALYTANFTPPKRVLQNITNTSLLLQVANSSAYITDSSTNAFTVTNGGSATYSPFTPVASVGEMQKIYSDGTFAVANYFDETNPFIVYSLGTAGAGGSGASSGSVGGDTTLTFNYITITGFGGGAGLNNSGTVPAGGSFSGGDGGSTGGNSASTTGDRGGGSGGAIGGTAGTNTTPDGSAGASPADVSGLFSALTGTGFSSGTGGTAGPRGAAGTSVNINNGGNASGIGAGGGSAGFYGGNGGNGSYGGGGGGAAGYTATQTGGTGGQGVIVLQITTNSGTSNTVLTSGTSYTLPAGTISFKAWAIGAGGGGGGCGPVDASSASGGGAGGVAYRTWTL